MLCTGRLVILMARPADNTAIRERVPAKERLVPRSALFGVLSGAASGQVVLLCAPAGSGKTVLLRSWADPRPLRTASRGSRSSAAKRTRSTSGCRVVDALADAVGEEGLVERVGATPAFRGEAVVERLLSDLGALDEPVVLVIDDLHELARREALRLLEHFLSELPPQVLVVLATRQDPGLGLHRLRLTGARWRSAAPTCASRSRRPRRLLGGGRHRARRTRPWRCCTSGPKAGRPGCGWRRSRSPTHPDPERFVAEFSGSERTVAAYLLAEVLERQPAEVRDLLLRTSILEPVSGPLADFLTGSSGSERILQQLEDANAFVVSLDAGGSWFRYHHLFADLLRLELRRTRPVDRRHRCTGRPPSWYEEHGRQVEAIRHAQAAGDWPHAARLLADSYVSLVFDGRTATLRALLAAFPEDARRHRRGAGARLRQGPALRRPARGERRIHRRGAAAGRHRARRAPARFDLQLRRPGSRSRVAAGPRHRRWRRCGPWRQRSPRSRRASWRSSNDLRAAALMNLGIAELWSSRPEDARRHLQQALELARRIGRPYLEIGCLGHLAMAAPLARAGPPRSRSSSASRRSRSPATTGGRRIR